MEVKIDSKKLEENVYTLKNDINEINIILENITKSVDKIPDIWNSTKEEEIVDSLKKTTDSFSDISEKNNKYINFLDLIVKGKYETLDKNLDELMPDETVIN